MSGGHGGLFDGSTCLANAPIEGGFRVEPGMTSTTAGWSGPVQSFEDGLNREFECA